MKRIILTCGVIGLFVGSAFATLNTPTINTLGTTPQPPQTLLDWNPVTNGNMYKIEYDTSSSFNSPVLHSEMVAATAFYASNLYFNATYYYRVKAYNQALTDSSVWSSADNFTTIATDTTFTLTGDTAIHPNDNEVIQDLTTPLIWSSTIGCSSYQVRIDTVPSYTSGALSIYSTNTNSYNIAHTFFNSTYYWSIRLIDAVDTSNWSSSFSFTTPASLPLFSPANDSVGAPCNVKMVWNKEYKTISSHVVLVDTVLSAIDYFHFEYDTSSSFNSNQLISFYSYAPGQDSVIANELLFGKKYYWRVQAIINHVDTSVWSSVWNYTILDSLQLYSPANGQTLHNLTPELKWQATTGVLGYFLEYATNSSFTGATTLTIPVGAPTDSAGHFQFPPNEIQKNVTYYWRVRTYQSKDTSDWSATNKFLCDQGVGIQSLSNANEISIFPNPASSSVNIKFNKTNETLKAISILNVLGKTIYEIDLNNVHSFDKTLNIKKLNVGMYFIQFKTSKGVISKKLIITE